MRRWPQRLYAGSPGVPTNPDATRITPMVTTTPGRCYESLYHCGRGLLVRAERRRLDCPKRAHDGRRWMDGGIRQRVRANRPCRDRRSLLVSVPLPCAQDLQGVGECRCGSSLHHCPVCGDVRVSAHHLRAGAVLRARSNQPQRQPLVTLLDLGETGMMIAMIFGYALLLVGIKIVVEGWRELHRAQKGMWLVKDCLMDWCSTRNTRARSSHSSVRVSSIGLQFSPSCCFPLSLLPITCWREAKNETWRKNAVTSAVLTASACRCLSRVGGNGAP